MTFPSVFRLVLLFGCVFALLVPPFQSPDEPNHFLRAYQVSEGHFWATRTADQRLGGILPVSLQGVCDSFAFLKNNPAARTDFVQIRRVAAVPLQTEQRAFLDFANTAVYAPTGYLPQAAAIAIMRWTGAGPLAMLYAARLANLLIWWLLVAAAVRLIPAFRKLFIALLLLPAGLVIAASANADVLTNGLCFWLIAVFMAKTGPIWPKIVAVLIVCANKLIALPLVLLHALCSAADASPVPATRPVFRTALLFAAGLLAVAGWGLFAQQQFIPYDLYHPDWRDTQTLNAGVDPSVQLRYILQHPLFFMKTMLSSGLHALPSTAAHIVGKFGWEKNYLPGTWLALLWLTLAAAVCLEKNPFSRRQRGLLCVIGALYIGAFAGTMYCLWCPVGATEITNWQGRYFVPVLPVLGMALGNGLLLRWEQWIWRVGVMVVIMSNLVMCLAIWERYYGG